MFYYVKLSLINSKCLFWIVIIYKCIVILGNTLEFHQISPANAICMNQAM